LSCLYERRRRFRMEIRSGVVLDAKESEIPVIVLEKKKGTDYGEICFMGDWHLGSGNFSLGQYIEYLAYLLEHPEIKVVLMGDLIEMGALSPYGASEEKVGSMQLLDVIRLLEPIKDRIIVMLEGNHEERFWRATKGTDTVTKSVADALKIHPLLPGPERGQLFMVKVGEQVYSVYAIHGSTGATIYKATQLSKVFANIHTSLAVHGHNHQIFKDHRTYYGVREIKGKYYLTVHEQYWLTTGCFVKNLGYAEKGAMPVTKIGAPFVRFYANREAIEIIDDPRITYGIGTGSRKIDLKKIGLKGLDLEKYEELRGFGGTQVLKKGRWVETEICPSAELDMQEQA
jgi:hypothetical protein